METFEVTGKIPAVSTNSPSDSSGHRASMESSSKPDVSPGEFTLNDLEAFTGEMLDKPPMQSGRMHSEYAPNAFGSEERTARRKLIQKIGMYRANYTKILKDFDLSRLDSKSLDELRLILVDVEYMVSTRKTLDSSRMMLLGGLYCVESVGPLVKCKLQGLTAKCMNSSEVMDSWDEVAIKYSDAIAADPLNRLMLTLMMAAVSTHKENSAVIASQSDKSGFETNPFKSETEKSTPLKSKAAQELASKLADSNESLDEIPDNIYHIYPDVSLSSDKSGFELSESNDSPNESAPEEVSHSNSFEND
jgi:hypothetical protein